LRAIVVLTLLTFFFISACNSGLSKHRKYSWEYPPKDKKNIKQLKTYKKKYKRKIQARTKRFKTFKKKSKSYKRRSTIPKKKIQKLPLPSNFDQVLLPSIISPNNGKLMVLVDRSSIPSSSSKTTPGDSIFHLNTTDNPKKIILFYIDRTEVSLTEYNKTHPTHDQTYITGEVCLLCPAMSVDWVHADKHCRAVGKRLPTETEWNLAAGTPLMKSTYLSKNNKRPLANLVGQNDGFLSVAPVGSFPLGAGPYGTLDMIGNVWEWVDNKDLSPQKKFGPKKNGNHKVIMGGGWTSSLNYKTGHLRNVVAGNLKNPTFGFRCAKSID
jgi:formylglycine-generating enzyme required for sulfatase activity